MKIFLLYLLSVLITYYANRWVIKKFVLPSWGWFDIFCNAFCSLFSIVAIFIVFIAAAIIGIGKVKQQPPKWL